MVDVPLAAAELEEMVKVNGRPLLKDETKLSHFLRRVTATSESLRRQIRSLQKELQDISQQNMRAGTPTTLMPTDAFRYLSDEQKEAVLGVLAREKLATLEQQRSQTAQTERVLRAAHQHLKYAVTQLFTDPDIDELTKAKLKQLLAAPPPATSDIKTGS